MRTRQEQNDDTRLQRARLRRGLTYPELGEPFDVTGATAERYCLRRGHPRKVNLVTRRQEKILQTLFPDLDLDNYDEPAAASRKRRVRA